MRTHWTIPEPTIMKRSLGASSWNPASHRVGAALALWLIAWGASSSADAQAASGLEELTFELRTPAGRAVTPSAPSVGLLLDDSTFEGVVGFGLTNARSFLWFNRFPAPGRPFVLEEIQVLFPSSESGLTVGDAVQIAVYHDQDGDPANGADLLATFDVAIQALDGVTFSIYPLDQPIWLVAEARRGDLLIGVVSRFAEGAVLAASEAQPATLDTSSPAGRSWVALWLNDPPDQPTLPADHLTVPLAGNFVDGNWMIRGSGRLLTTTDIPTLSSWGIALLIGLLAVGGLTILHNGRGGW